MRPKPGNHVGAPSLLTAPSCLSQTSQGHPRQVTLQLCILPGSWKSAPRCPAHLRDHQPAGKCPWTSHSSGRNCTAPLTDSNKQRFVHKQVPTTAMETCTLPRVWSSFPFLPAARMHPTQLWNTPNSVGMRLKNSHRVLGIYGRGHLFPSRFVFFGLVAQPVYHLQY